MTRKVSIITDSNGTKRCWWPGEDPLYLDYHDNEWGRQVHDDNRLFEKICLEGFQSGLSWITILRKRESFRRAFKNFEIAKVARMNQKHVEKLLTDASIVRHRGKIESTINNAGQALKLIKDHDSLAEYFWSFKPSRKRKFDRNRAFTPESTALSKDLKKHGWSFVGPTTCYAFMQAMGMVNDHHPKCFCYSQMKEG